MARRASPNSSTSTARPAARRAARTVMVVTGSRAEFGLLRPVMDAVRSHGLLRLRVCVTGEHLLAPANTWREVRERFGIDARVRMQRARPARRGLGDSRQEHAGALGRGVEGIARVLSRLKPDWVVVLGDRIEAFAAASAASVAGVGVCHIHGGDRAEGIADEAMRHAITKLSHLHCAATAQSGERIRRMGEAPEHVHVTGSPAIDDLGEVRPMSDAEAEQYGNPRTIVLHHPSGLPPARERAMIHAIMYGVEVMTTGNVLCLAPNHDPGREIIDTALRARCASTPFEVHYSFRGGMPTFRVRAQPSRKPACGRETSWTIVQHLPRPVFLSLLKRLAPTEKSLGGLLVGNSSAGLIEAAALGVRVVNVGPRQNGRERGETVVDVPEDELAIIGTRIDRALSLVLPQPKLEHPFGDGRAGERIAELLAAIEPGASGLLRKRNAF